MVMRADIERNVLAARNLSKHYGKTCALDAVSLDVAPGELLVVAGPNGAGKTTLLEICEGLRQPDSGEVFLFGKSPKALDVRQRMGVQLDEASFHRHLKVKEIIWLYGKLYGRTAEAPGVIEGLGLSQHWLSRYETLSRGWKQRVSIAVALLHEPDLVFLDEVSGGLDPEAKHLVWDLILAQTQRGAAVVLTSHSMEEAERLADRVLIIVEGRVVRNASPSSLLAAFPSRAKVEIPGEIEGPIPDVVGRSFQNGRTVLYTDEPERVLGWAKSRDSAGRVFSGALNLEDLYLYYVKQGQPCSPQFLE
jgi:ABC-2 type transport system ATP-binding protein